MSIYFRAKTKDGTVRNIATPFTFPGGEHHLKMIEPDQPTTAPFTQSATQPDPDLPANPLHSASTVWIADVRGGDVNDLVRAALLADIAHSQQAPFVLLLPYLPAARSDRGQPTGARVYSNLINSMNAQQVIGIDAHSPLIHRYLRNLTERDPFPLLRRALGWGDPHSKTDWDGHADKYDAVIAPDKGAVGRAEAAAKLGWGLDVYHAEKERDFDTGKILSIKMTEKLPESGRYLVVDDICDGGGTFKGLAEAIGVPKEQLGLWVTHGIFSGDAPSLRQHYQNIYTTDSHPGHGRVGVATVTVPVETYMTQNLKEFGTYPREALV